MNGRKSKRMPGKQFSKREKVIFAVCVTLVFSYILFYGLLRPFKEKVEAAQSRIEVVKRQMQKDYKVISQAKAYEKQHEEVLKKFKQNTSDEIVMSSILSEIEKVANESKMSIEELKPQRVKKVDFYNYFSVSLAIDGQLKEILRFLNILQNEPYLFEVDELRFDKTSPHIPSLKCRLVISKITIP